MDWFVMDGPYAKVKSEYSDLFYDTLEKMHEAQMKECAQAREQLVSELTEEQKEYLSSKYDPKDMSYSEYRSFIDDLCKFGYFAEEDKPYVSCGGGSGSLVMTPLSYYSPQCGASLSTAPYVPGCANPFPANGGNVLAWVKSLSSFGTYDPASGSFEKTQQARLFEKLQNILLQMKKEGS